MKKILVIHGPNLNLLGKREPDIYGDMTLDAIDSAIRAFAEENSLNVETYQSNSEAGLIDKIQDAMGRFDAIVINPAAYTHTSVALRDAILAVGIPAIEVHLSNIYKRETFRQNSLIADVVVGRISGFGYRGYLLALRAVMDMV
ncbi:MAG: type II 3-dehydroquinate dehydratase [Thermodesulfobacteriota bacterium]